MSLLAAVPAARAADAQAEEALALDQAIEVLKDEALQLNGDAQAVEEDFTYPPHTRVTLYVSVETAALLLHRLALDIDGGDTVAYEYRDADARALLTSKGMQKLGRFNVSKGSHRLHAEFVGQYADAKVDEPLIADRFDGVFDKGYAPLELELIVGKASRGSKPSLRLKQWSAEK